MRHYHRRGREESRREKLTTPFRSRLANEPSSRWRMYTSLSTGLELASTAIGSIAARAVVAKRKAEMKVVDRIVQSEACSSWCERESKVKWLKKVEKAGVEKKEKKRLSTSSGKGVDFLGYQIAETSESNHEIVFSWSSERGISRMHRRMSRNSSSTISVKLYSSKSHSSTSRRPGEDMWRHCLHPTMRRHLAVVHSIALRGVQILPFVLELRDFSSSRILEENKPREHR